MSSERILEKLTASDEELTRHLKTRSFPRCCSHARCSPATPPSSTARRRRCEG